MTKLLIVEDDGLIGAYLATSLRRLRYVVAGPFDTGEAAVPAVAVERPDLVLMDIHLAGALDGVAAAELIRERYGLPVVFLTAHADAATLARAKLTEPFGYLAKPFHEASLQATVEVALYKHALTQQLKESEARYHIVADHTADWEYWRGPAGEWLYCSPACAWITGRPPEFFLAEPGRLDALVAPEDQAAWTAHTQAATAELGEARLEFRVLHPDGTPRWIEHVCRPVFDAAGVYRGRRASNRDCTVRKAAEAALEREKQRYQLLLQTSTDAIHVVDQAGRLREWNAAFLAHLGYTPEEAAGLNAADWDAQWDAAQLRRKIQELIQTPARFETRHRRKDGQVRAVEIYASGVTLDGEQMLYASARDITDRLNLERALQAERDFALSVMNAMGQGLTVVDAAKRFEYINPAYAHFTGYAPEQILGRTPQEMTLAADQTSHTTVYESRLRHADGREVPVLVTGAPRWRDGQVTGTIAVITDLTEQKRTEARLRQQAETLAGLHQLALSLLAQRHRETILPIIVSRAGGLLAAPHVLLALREAGQLVVHASSPAAPFPAGPALSPAQAPLAWQALAAGAAVTAAEAGRPAQAFIPIQSDAGPTGVLAFARESDAGAFTETDLDAGRLLAQLVALALENADLHATASAEIEERRAAEASLYIVNEQLIAYVREIELLQAALREQAIRDPLTGVFNRRYMEETLQRELDRMERQGQGLGVLIIDCDHFKGFNDAYGHAAGDEVLRALAGLLTRQVRSSDIVCRYGGEEFVIILPDTPPLQIARRAATLCRAARELRVTGAGHTLPPVTLSIGVALYPFHAGAAAPLLAAADAGLYAAKQAGRDRVRLARRPAPASRGAV